LAEEERPLDVDVVVKVPDLLCHLEQLSGLSHLGAVYQRVYLADLFVHSGYDRLDLIS